MVLALVAMGCGAEDPVEPDPRSELDFTGTWNPSPNFGGPWGHDGNPVVTDHFKVFSGFASQSARQFTADVAEESITELMTLMDLTVDDFDFLPSYDEEKIHILALGTQNFNRNSGFAYRDGLVVVSREHENYRSFGFTEDVYKRLIKHETMHVIEFLLIGDPRFQQASDVWLREGFANVVSGPRPSTVTTRAEVEAWREANRDVPGGGNPIAIHVWSDFPSDVLQPVNRTITYYPYFELAAGFLVDPDGLGRTVADVKAIYERQGEGINFARAFRENMGMELSELEAGFWDLILEYLDRKAASN